MLAKLGHGAAMAYATLLRLLLVSQAVGWI